MSALIWLAPGCASWRRDETHRQSSSVHWCTHTPSPPGSVLRIFEFELGNQSPKLNLVTIGQPSGPLGCGRVVRAVKVDDASQLAMFIQNVRTIVWHRKSPGATASYLQACSAVKRFWVITSYP